jgi:hypothetical protein
VHSINFISKGCTGFIKEMSKDLFVSSLFEAMAESYRPFNSSQRPSNRGYFFTPYRDNRRSWFTHFQDKEVLKLFHLHGLMSLHTYCAPNGPKELWDKAFSCLPPRIKHDFDLLDWLEDYMIGFVIDRFCRVAQVHCANHEEWIGRLRCDLGMLAHEDVLRVGLPQIKRHWVEFSRRNAVADCAILRGEKVEDGTKETY